MSATDPERFRIYAVRPCLDQRLLATTDQDGLGVALVTLAAEGELDGYSVGILDRPEGQETGTWIVNPFGANHERSDD